MIKPKIVLFSHPDCPPCQVLKMLLEGKGVAFEERDITKDPSAVRELMEKYHSHSTPTLIIGDEVLIGFDPERIDKILGD